MSFDTPVLAAMTTNDGALVVPLIDSLQKRCVPILLSTPCLRPSKGAKPKVHLGGRKAIELEECCIDGMHQQLFFPFFFPVLQPSSHPSGVLAQRASPLIFHSVGAGTTPRRRGHNEALSLCRRRRRPVMMEPSRNASTPPSAFEFTLRLAVQRLSVSGTFPLFQGDVWGTCRGGRGCSSSADLLGKKRNKSIVFCFFWWGGIYGARDLTWPKML